MKPPAKRALHIYRGDNASGELREFTIETCEGMVVLDAILKIQAETSGDLAARCNCRAGKCGSCAADINGKPSLMCKTHITSFPGDKPITVRPLKSFPVIKDIVADVSWNYKVNKLIPVFTHGDDLRMRQNQVEQVQELRKCIECFICQSACHVLSDQSKKDVYFGPRGFVKLSALHQHPSDIKDRIELVKEKGGVEFCNVTRCCTELCPEKIRITDNAIIPLKEAVVDKYYDPLKKLARVVKKYIKN